MPGAGLPPLGFAGPPYHPAGVRPAGNDIPGRNKPAGGLWLAPVTRAPGGGITGTAWTRYCERNHHLHAGPQPGARLTLVPLRATARVAAVSGPGDFSALAADAGTVTNPPQSLAGAAGLDWEGVRRLADAVWLTSDGVASLGGFGDPFYWWDAETVIVLQPGVLAAPGCVLARPAPSRGRRGQPAYAPAEPQDPAAAAARGFTAGREPPPAPSPGRRGPGLAPEPGR